jgi:hypothetical protein
MDIKNSTVFKTSPTYRLTARKYYARNRQYYKNYYETHKQYYKHYYLTHKQYYLDYAKEYRTKHKQQASNEPLIREEIVVQFE